jgi:hypothetical protein
VEPAVDTLYLPAWQPPPSWDLKVSREFSQNSWYPHTPDRNWHGWGQTEMWHDSLAAVQHLAIPCKEPFLKEYGILRRQKMKEIPSSYNWSKKATGPPWLKGFADLQSASFLIDHFPTFYRAGDILLYEPLDDSVLQNFRGETPAELEWWIEKVMDDFKCRFEPNWIHPEVEILILGYRKTRKRSGFCLPPSSTVPQGSA